MLTTQEGSNTLFSKKISRVFARLFVVKRVLPEDSCRFYFLDFFLRPRVPCLYSWMQVTAAILHGVELS